VGGPESSKLNSEEGRDQLSWCELTSETNSSMRWNNRVYETRPRPVTRFRVPGILALSAVCKK
jgi:hypothetical protein